MKAPLVTVCQIIFVIFITLGSSTRAESDLDIELWFRFNWAALKPEESKIQQAKIQNLLSQGHLSYPLLFHDSEFVAVVPARVRLDFDRRSAEFEVGLSQVLERPLYDISLAAKDRHTYEIKITYPILSVDKYDGSLDIDALSNYETTVKDTEGKLNVELPLQPYLIIADFAQRNIGRKTVDPSIPIGHYWREKEFYLPPVVWHDGSWSTKALADSNTDEVSKSVRVYSENTKEGWAKEVSDFGAVRKGCSACASPSETNFFNPESWFEIKPRERLYLSTTPADAEILLSGSALPERTDREVKVPRSDWSAIVLHKADVGDCRVKTEAILSPVGANEPFKFYCKLGPTILESKRN